MEPENKILIMMHKEYLLDLDRLDYVFTNMKINSWVFSKICSFSIYKIT